MSSAAFVPMPCPKRLAPDTLARLRRQGYLAVRDLLAPDEVTQARERISKLVHYVADQHDAVEGNVLRDQNSRLHLQLEPSISEIDPRDPELEMKLRKLMGYVSADEWFYWLAHEHPRLRGLLDDILGPDSRLFQDMALIKPAKIGREKPWHQDNAYFSVTPLDQVMGVWIALDEATVENGCKHVMPGAHREGALKHYHGADCQIVEDRLQRERAVPIPLPAGGALFFFGMLPHFTPPNRSHHRRRALQLHYRGADTTDLERAAYDKVFAEPDGTPASCAAARD